MTASAIAILQTGRLGDLWFTVPLADHLASRGHTVEVWYDGNYGDPFTFFPSVTPKPVRLRGVLPGAGRIATVANSAAAQLVLYAQLKRLGRTVIWNQIYPFRVGAYLENRPYPCYWYRHFPEVAFRRARTTLTLANDRTILYFAASASLRIDDGGAYRSWLEANLHELETHTGYRVIYVPPPGGPEHPRYETWRGDLAAYQQLIARCGIVFGISTSAHVLGQLLGKTVIPCYVSRSRLVDTIGEESVRLFPGDTLGPEALSRL